MKTHEYKNIMVDGKMRETYKLRHPSHLTLVYKKALTQYKQDAEKWNRFQKLSHDDLLSDNKCNMSDTGTAALWTMFAIAPALSPDALSMIIPLAYMMFAEHLSLGLGKTMLEKIAAATPSPTTLRNKMMDLGHHCQQVVKSRLEDRGGTPVFLACDAGNRKGNDHPCKYVSYYCNKRNKVCVDLVDSLPTAGKSSQNAADAIAQSMESVGVRLSGTTTDSGGGGVLDSLAGCLDGLGTSACNFTRGAKSVCNFTVAACALHGVNLMISTPWEHVDGVGGLGKRNALQAVHTVHWLQAHTWGEGLCTSATKSCCASTALVAGRDQCVLPVKAEAAAAAEERRAKRQRRAGTAADVDVSKPARAATVLWHPRCVGRAGLGAAGMLAGLKWAVPHPPAKLVSGAQLGKNKTGRLCHRRRHCKWHNMSASSWRAGSLVSTDLSLPRPLQCVVGRIKSHPRVLGCCVSYCASRAESNAASRRTVEP